MEQNKVEIGWNFDNSYSKLPEVFYKKIKPTPVRSPQMVVLNESLATFLGLSSDALYQKEGVQILAGNSLIDDMVPIAQAYAGHQFGHFTMLGDGRAILLGEHLMPSGERVDIQLKGSGRTPFSRGGDGRAALGPMLREYIISEAMDALGIPTTRSLSVVLTGESIIRETPLQGAILTRVAASHIRVGTFQYAANWGTQDELKALADYTIQRHYPEVKISETPYLNLLKAVIKKQAELIAKWQLVGFIHGVMNTDNVLISGETIDYGPCAFMDTYDPETVFSSIDSGGRYAYGNQPQIGVWNMARFAETLVPLLHQAQNQAVEIAKEALNDFVEVHHEHWLNGMRAKLGIFNEEDQDEVLVVDLLEAMHKNQADFTNTFCELTLGERKESKLSQSKEYNDWYAKWQARLSRQSESTDAVSQLMKRSNPAIIPRNHRVEEALRAAVEENDLSVMQKYVKALREPFAYSAEQEEYTSLPAPSNCRYQTFCGT